MGTNNKKPQGLKFSPLLQQNWQNSPTCAAAAQNNHRHLPGSLTRILVRVFRGHLSSHKESENAASTLISPF